jgi:hypothetical protein
MLKDWDSIPGRSADFYLSSQIQIGSASYPVGTWDAFPGLKRTGWRKSDHTSPCNAEVKEDWRNVSSPPYIFMM